MAPSFVLPQALQSSVKMLGYILSWITWRNLLFLYLVANIKNLPLVWELRLICRGWHAWKNHAVVAKILNAAAYSKTSHQSPSDNLRDALNAEHAHPIFAPVSISSHTPLLEIDHNLHKSNSTYFSDLDESRTALMTHLLSPTKFSGKELEGEGFKGRLSIVLGSVHASFLKEIKPYESYTIKSRVLGWDSKWIVIVSWFIKVKSPQREKRMPRQDKREPSDTTELSQKEKKSSEILLAACLSKYVVKKGRYTVPPERSFRAAGWLPDRPTGAAPLPPSSTQIGTPTTEADGSRKNESSITKGVSVQDIAAEAAEKLKSDLHDEENNRSIFYDEACATAAANWTWEEIETERARGMSVAEGWLKLDAQLKEEYAEEILNKSPGTF